MPRTHSQSSCVWPPGKSVAGLFDSVRTFVMHREISQADGGFSLAVVYLSWLALLAALYPLCRWFARVKRERRAWWLSYL